MARSKPYTFALGMVDLLLFFATGGVWLIVMAIRELYRFNGPRSTRRRARR